MFRPLLVILLAAGCHKATKPADPEFSDALIFLLSEFEGPEAELAFAMRDLEGQIATDMDVTASNPNDRALAPALLTRADVSSFDLHNTDRDISAALPVAVAGLSAFGTDDHAGLQLLSDQTPVEPYSPDHYQRTFSEGADCFDAQGCGTLRTDNDLTKDNLLMTLDYQLFKDFRWVDLELPDPSSVPDGEEPVNVGDPRWAILARSWTDRSFAGRNENSWIHQSFTIEMWIPQGKDTVRLLSLWSESEFDGLSVSDDAVIATTRSGIDRNFEAADDYLEGQR
jgi:hypothetical protein